MRYQIQMDTATLPNGLVTSTKTEEMNGMKIQVECRSKLGIGEWVKWTWFKIKNNGIQVYNGERNASG